MKVSKNKKIKKNKIIASICRIKNIQAAVQRI